MLICNVRGIETHFHVRWRTQRLNERLHIAGAASDVPQTPASLVEAPPCGDDDETPCSCSDDQPCSRLARVHRDATQENYSYSAPSGAFGDGTFKWQMFRFMAEDRERVLALRAGGDPAATGSIQGSATTNESVAAPARPAAGARSRAWQPSG